MRLKKITLNNIRSYRNQEVVFPDGSTLLSGDIGSGKTSILLAIEFGLFGLQPGQKGSSLLRNGSDSGRVVLEFEIGGKDFVVERSLKKGSKSVSQDSCAIHVDGEKSEISVMELKSRILDALNYPREFSKKQNLLYKFTVYTPQEEMKQIILEDSETRINTLRHVFGIDKYKKILENSSVLALKIREEKRIGEALVSTLEQDRLNLISKEEELENRHYNLASVEKEFFLKEQERKKAQEEKREIELRLESKRKIMQEIEKNRIIINGKKELLSGNLKMLERLKIQASELETLNFDEPEILRLEIGLRERKKQKEEIDDENMKIFSKINFYRTKINDDKLMIEKIRHLENCPTCFQEVNMNHKNKITEKANSDIKQNAEGVESAERERKSITEKLAAVNLEISAFEKKIQELNIAGIKFRDFREKQSRIIELEKNNADLDLEISGLGADIESKEKSLAVFSELDEIFTGKQREFDDLTRQERLAEIKVAELKKEIEVFSGQIEELKTRVKNLEVLTAKNKYLSELENWISQKFTPLISFMERNVMLKLKSEFSRLLLEWFLMLVSENFSVRLSDDFTPIIEQRDYEIDYAYLSGGERTAIALAYRLALNQVINSLMSKLKTKDIVILDEPTDGFSEQQLDKMRDVFSQLNAKQLIIVSHEQKIEGFVDNVIRFRKENGVSVVSE